MSANKTGKFAHLSYYKASCPALTVLLLLSVLLSLSSSRVYAEKLASIIIDDLGNSYEYGFDVINLPGALTLAILPRTNYAKELARLAIKSNKEVMLHLPLQSVENQMPSPGTLDLHMTRKKFIQQLRLNLNAVPYVRGVNNHMGSLLTRHPGHMRWLMDELARRGNLYFVDSKTTSQSIADKIAVEHHIPNLSRDFFLDPQFDEKTIRKQFDLFIQKINHRGYALAIAHPHPNTIKFLQSHLNELAEQGITLITVSRLIQHSGSPYNQQALNVHKPGNL